MTTEETITSENKIQETDIREAVRQEVSNAIDPKVLAEELRNQETAAQEEDANIRNEIASQYEDFNEVYTNDKFKEFQKENKAKAEDIIYFYQQGDKARAYERVYQELKAWQNSKTKVPVQEKKETVKKEQPIPESRDPTLAGGSLKEAVSVPSTPTIGVLERKSNVVQSTNNSLVDSDYKVRVARSRAEARAIRDDALGRLRKYNSEMKQQLRR